MTVKYDMSNEDYHAHSAMSRSGLSLIDQAPKKYWYKYLSGQHEDNETDALRIGSVFHTMTLEPSEFANRVSVWSGAPRNTKAGKEEYAAAVEAAGGRILVKQAEVNNLKGMVSSILSEPAAKKIITGTGKIEPSFFWDDPATGLAVKCRPDYYRDDGIVLDLKTCLDASEAGFKKSILNYYYDIQVYMCLSGIEAVTGKRPSAFVFVAVEKDPPHCTAFYLADETVIASGEARYNRLMEIYAACKKSNVWPAYGSLIKNIGMPEWYMKQKGK